MGKTVVSSNRTFRKVQLMAPSLAGGVVSIGAAPASNFLVGYIELATGNQLASVAPANVAPVAYLPGLL
jgi:hypothetical protein